MCCLTVHLLIVLVKNVFNEMSLYNLCLLSSYFMQCNIVVGTVVELVCNIFAV